MDRLKPFFILILTLLGLSGLLLVALPYAQLDGLPPDPGLSPYTRAEARGRAQYVSLGCVYCHTQQPRDPGFAPDAARGWGRTPTPADYTFDYPHQLGTMRTGPDLLNIGARQPSQDWHLTHLYQPRAVVEWSVMPAYPFLFEVKPSAGPDDVVVSLPPAFRPPEGVVVAGPDALDLVAYLKSLDRTYPSRYLPAPAAEAAR